MLTIYAHKGNLWGWWAGRTMKEHLLGESLLTQNVRAAVQVPEHQAGQVIDLLRNEGFEVRTRY